jgi:cell fate regulator YaaT (PSP1 superfamily)
MPLAVGVSFRQIGRQYWFDPGNLVLDEGDQVVVETSRGLELGTVRTRPRELPESVLALPLKPVLRKASPEDLHQAARNAERAQTALQVATERVRHHGLPMKPLTAEYTFDGSQVTICFVAETRVDFRELVRDLAGQLRCRVQLYQVGARDQARLIGGHGTCGREYCCRSFLTDFAPISMRMAKDQSLFLNPAKFSGACGKLMCCLRYEHDVYVEARAVLPNVGARVTTARGTGTVVGTSVIRREVTVSLDESEAEIACPLADVALLPDHREHSTADAVRCPHRRHLPAEHEQARDDETSS